MGRATTDHRLRYGLLGPTVVWEQLVRSRDGATTERELGVGGPRQRRLLAVLLLAGGRVVPVDRLVDAVWGDEPEPPDSAARVVLSYVSRLRSALGDGAVVTHDHGYALLRQPADLDADLFVERVAALDGATPAAIVASVETALAAWRGRALGEFADEPWARGTAARLEELRLVALERRSHARIELGAFAEVVPELESLAAEHPLRERFRAQLMTALHRSGRQAEALRAYQAYRSLLADETGLDPSRDLAELERRIARDDPTLAAPDRSAHVHRGYVLGDVIGEGAFGRVYRAVQPAVGREVAVKVVRAELADDPAYIRRFDAEARLVARLEHPHVVPLYDYWREPGGAYLVFRYLRGGTAADTAGPWPLDRVERVVADVAGALAAAHDAGVIHRDVKPANILFDEQGRAYLADFGIAVDAVAADESGAGLRSAGSPLYASPEQVRDGVATPASDQYALAVVAWELLAGAAPFDADRVTALLEAKLRDTVPPIGARRSDVPAALDTVLRRASAVHPADRYPSVVDFFTAWSAALAGPAAPARTTVELPAVGGQAPSPASATLARLRADAANPYKGLRAFDEADSTDLFGRDDAVAELNRLVAAHRFVTVVGPSGSGKSSLVRAGLVPAARAAGAYVAVVTPGDEPVERLADAFVRLSAAPPADLRERLVDAARLPATIDEVLPDDTGELMVVIDQFEELWTMTDAGVRDRLLAALVAACAADGSRVRVVATVRADFYDRPLAHPVAGPVVGAATYALAPLDVAGIEQAITGPAQRVGVRVEPALVAALVADVTAQPNGLPLLQYTLTELYDRREGATMGRAGYDAIGGLVGALARRADEVYGALDEAGRAGARRLFARLVTAGEGTEDTRRRARRRELVAVDDAVVEAFGRARLVAFDVDAFDREPTVEVAHEALIRHWPRLRAWIDEDRDGLRVARHLADAARAWSARGGDDGDLYRGARLQAALDWAADRPDDINDVEHAFLAASSIARDALAQREQRQHRRIRRALAAVAAVAVLALLASAIAVQRQRAASQAQARADTAAATATDARAAAETRRLASEAAARAADDPQLALLLAVEAHRRDPGPVGLGALQRVLTGTGTLLGYTGAGRSVARVRWLGDRRLVSAGPDGLSIDDVATGAATLRVPDLRVLTSYYFEGDGQRKAFPLADMTGERAAAVVTEHPDEVRTIDLATGAPVGSPVGHGAPVLQLAAAPDGTGFATIDADGDLRMIDAATGALRWRVAAHPERVIDDVEAGWPAEWVNPWGFDIGQLAPNYGRPVFAFTADGAEIVSSYGTIRRWRALDGAERPSGMRPPEDLFRTGPSGFGGLLWAIAPDGRALVVDRSRLRLLGPDGGRVLATRTLPSTGTFAGTPKVLDLSWLDGDRALVLTTDGRLVIVSVPGLDIVGQPIDTRLSEPVSMSVSPDGRTVAVASADGIGRWSLSRDRILARSVPRYHAQQVSLSADAGELTTTEVEWEFAFPAPGHRLDIRGDVPTELAMPTDPTYGYWWLDRSPYLFTMSAFQPVAWDPASGRTIRYATAGSWSGFTIDPSAERIAFGSSAGGVQIFDLHTGDLLLALPELGNSVNSLSFSADGTRLAGATADGRAAAWDSRTGKAIDVDLGTADGPVQILRYSPDGRWLVTADGTGTLRLRDPLTHAVEQTLLAGSDRLIGNTDLMWFSTDGRYLLNGTGRSARLWDLAAGAQIGEPFPNEPDVKVESNDGLPTLVTGEGDRLLLWNLDLARWAEIACKAAGRQLTEQEWAQFGPKGEPYAPAC